MASRIWTGLGADGLWGDPANWSNGTLPGPGDNVTLGLTGSQTVTLNVNASVQSLTMSTGGTLDIAGFTLATSGSLNLADGASITGYGVLDINNHIAGTGSILAAGGTLVLDVNGTIDGTVSVSIGAGADLKIEGSPSFTGAIAVGAGSELEIANGAAVKLSAEEITTGGTIQLDGGSLKDNSGIILGGTLSGAGTVNTGNTAGTELQGGTVIAAGGTLEFTNAVDQTGTATSFTIDNGATLTFDNAVGTTGPGGIAPSIAFQGGEGTLDLSNAPKNSFHGAVTDFLAGDKIVVAGADDTVTRIGNDTIEIESGKTVEAIISLGPNPAAFTVSSDGTTTTITAICFMAGTLIRTPNGEAPVETLQRGDLVMTHDGTAKPIAWLGRQTISTLFADKLRVWPVRMKAGAIADNVPSRDLLLSPGHAVLIEGALVLAGALVNGTSIVREPTVPEVFTYYHIELDGHALVLAENTPAETFIDHVDRLAFDNWDEHEALYPDGRDIAELPYPVAKSHRQVPASIRRKLAARAALTLGVSAAVA